MVVKTRRKYGTKRHSMLCPCGEHIRTQTELYAPLLRKLGSGGPVKKRNVVSKCDPCFIRFLGRCACGVLNTNIHLKPDDYSSLKGSKEVLLKLAHPNTSVSIKRTLLKRQSGAAFPFLSVLGTLASTVLSNLFLK
jgi:hypothetical protein